MGQSVISVELVVLSGSLNSLLSIVSNTE